MSKKNEKNFFFGGGVFFLPCSPVRHRGPPSPWSWPSWVSAAGPGSTRQVLRGTPSLGRAGSRSVSKIKSSVLAFTCRCGKWRWEQSVCNQEPHSFNDVCRVEGDVLHARSPVVVHVFLWGRTRRTEKCCRKLHSPKKRETLDEWAAKGTWICEVLFPGAGSLMGILMVSS